MLVKCTGAKGGDMRGGAAVDAPGRPGDCSQARHRRYKLRHENAFLHLKRWQRIALSLAAVHIRA